MVKIRLTRLGKHKDPFYRIVATDSRTKRDGGFIAILGTYEPFSGKTLIKSEQVLDLLNKGAQPTDTILNLFKQNGIWAEYLKAKKTTKKTKKTRKSKNAAAKKAARKAAKAKAKAQPAQPKVEQPKTEPVVENKPTEEVKQENK